MKEESDLPKTNADDARDHENAVREADPAEVLDAYSQAVMSVVDAVGPAVVSISVGERTSDHTFDAAGSGSGFAIAPDGYMLTNNHVVSGAKHIETIATDGSKFLAEIVGTDPATDLAVIRVNGSGLPFAALGDSKSLRVGQLVIAMGNPFGFQSTVSTGVISSVGRALRSSQGRLIENVIQHTAPLNPGNSGGPLLDSHGRVIGINTAIIALAQGIGFSIPSNTAKWVVAQLLLNGHVRRAYLGIVGNTRHLNRRIVRYHNLLKENAVEIASVEPDGPAGSSGIRPGDLVVAIRNEAVESLDDIVHYLTDTVIGIPLAISVVRGKERLEFTVQPAEAKA
jgi:S1-C subfamily serine protease